MDFFEPYQTHNAHHIVKELIDNVKKGIKSYIQDIQRSRKLWPPQTQRKSGNSNRLWEGLDVELCRLQRKYRPTF